jgi:hypothetical protein
MSKRHAAELAGMSEGRWRQLEAGGVRHRGHWETETAPAPTLARMAQAAGVTRDELRACGREDAAAELAALPPLPEQGRTIEDLFREYESAREEDRKYIRRLEGKIDQLMDRQQHDEQQHEESIDDDEDQQDRGSRAV